MKFLVVDDDLLIQNALASGLRQGWPDSQVLCAGDGRTALQYFHRFAPDLLVLDLGLPHGSGSEVVRAIRKVSDLPILVLTGQGGEIEQVRLLSQGADDFLAKPYSLPVLEAHIKSLLRRTEAVPPERSRPPFVAGELTIDFERLEVFLRGQRVRLTPIEQRLLFYLARRAGQVCSHREILDQVWGSAYGATPEYLKVFVSRVRAKLPPPAGDPPFIETERGIGYRFVRPLTSFPVSPLRSVTPAGGAMVSGTPAARGEAMRGRPVSRV